MTLAIVWQAKEDKLWYAQEQGVCGRETIGGYASSDGCLIACLSNFGQSVEIEFEEEDTDDDR